MVLRSSTNTELKTHVVVGLVVTSPEKKFGCGGVDLEGLQCGFGGGDVNLERKKC
jgi:hypothetical protein